MHFGQAFEAVETGKAMAMRLPHWKEDVRVKVQHPDKTSNMTAPYLYVESRHGRVPWKETMIELFSREWEVVQMQKSPGCGVDRGCDWGFSSANFSI